MDRNTPLKGTGAFTPEDIDSAFARYGGAPFGLGLKIFRAAERAGLNVDFFACQVADETRWWTSDDATLRNNPSGFGHTDGAPAGTRFLTIDAGLQASAAHWLTYIDGDNNPLAGEDPRFDLVPAEHRGIARTIGDIGNGVWATAPDYPQAILNRYAEFLDNGAHAAHTGPMRIILSAGHLNIGEITAEKGMNPALLRTATGALGTEALPNQRVVERAAAALARAGVEVVETDACYHPEVYDADADLCVFVHHDGTTAFGHEHPQWSGADVVHSGPSTEDVDNRAQQFVDAWKRLQGATTGVTDEHVDTNDMLQYYGGWYRTANTPAALVECSIWGDAEGERADVDTDKEGDALAIAIGAYLGVTIDGQVPTHDPGDQPGGTDPGPGGDGDGESDDRTWPLAGGAFTAHAHRHSGDGRGISIRDERTGLDFRIGHGFYDEWITGLDMADPAAAFERALADDGAPITAEFTCVYPLVRNGQPTTVQFFERARYEWDPDSGVVTRGRVGAEAMSRFQGVLPVGSGHAA